MKTIGLTGSIGMGKSTASMFLRRLGVPVYEADNEVHKMYAAGGAAVAPIAKAFPTAIRGGAVDRGMLSEILRQAPTRVRELEAIVHPLARRAQRRFLSNAAMRRCPVAVLDIPLLFETGGDLRCDAVIVVSAPAFLQRQRVLRRSGMTPAKFELLLGRQMPDAEKRRRADFVIETNRGFRATFAELRKILARLGWKTGKRPRRKLRSTGRRR